jgi:hypothetical protein
MINPNLKIIAVCLLSLHIATVESTNEEKFFINKKWRSSCINKKAQKYQSYYGIYYENRKNSLIREILYFRDRECTKHSFSIKEDYNCSNDGNNITLICSLLSRKKSSSRGRWVKVDKKGDLLTEHSKLTIQREKDITGKTKTIHTLKQHDDHSSQPILKKRRKLDVFASKKQD